MTRMTTSYMRSDGTESRPGPPPSAIPPMKRRDGTALYSGEAVKGGHPTCRWRRDEVLVSRYHA